MNNVKKILICIALVSCLSVGAIGCSSAGGDADSDSQAEVSTSDSVDGDDADTNDDTQQQGDDADADTEETSEGDADADTTTVADGDTTDSSTEEEVETVAMTDSDGNTVTDNDGNVVTQKVVNSSNSNATTNAVVTVDGDSANDSNSNGNSSDDSSSDGDTTDSNVYFAKNAYAILLWMSDDTSNKYDSGEMVELTFKVKDDAENGDYPVEFNYVEMYDTNTDIVPFTVQNGTVTVGKDKSVTAQGAATSGANFRIDNATAQPGDTFKVKIYLDNNPGMALNKIELKYDSKALEVESITPVGAFSDETIESNLNASKSTKK